MDFHSAHSNQFWNPQNIHLEFLDHLCMYFVLNYYILLEVCLRNKMNVTPGWSNVLVGVSIYAGYRGEFPDYDAATDTNA